MTEHVENQEAMDSQVDGANILAMSDDEFISMASKSTIPQIQEEEVPVVEQQVAETVNEETIEKNGEANPEINYEELYKELLKPFNANGKEMKVDSVEDARQLMQMGANYHKKMQGMKPHLKVIKMLEQNELLDEGKLSYLIDISKKNPEAIKQLLKEANIDPLDIDTQSESQYTPNNYQVSDTQIELSEVESMIRETPQFTQTIEVIQGWDSASKNVLTENPRLIATINDHIGNGIYQQINDVVEQQRMLGRLTDVSDLEAYKIVGDYLQENNLFKTSQPKQETVVQPQVQVTTQVKQPNNVKQAKLAASPTKSVPAKQLPADFNPLNLSDEEFEKLYAKTF